MPRMMPLYQAIATALQSYLHCASDAANPSQQAWESRWHDALDSYAREYLPNGSGFDVVPVILSDTYSGRLVISGSFHRMDECGGYCGWRDFVVTVRPDLSHGFTLKVSGRRGDLSEYIAESYHSALSTLVDADSVLSPDTHI